MQSLEQKLRTEQKHHMCLTFMRRPLICRDSLLRSGLPQDVIDRLRIKGIKPADRCGVAFLLRPGKPRAKKLSVRVEVGGQPRNAGVGIYASVKPILADPILKRFFSRLGYNESWQQVYLWEIVL
jgi:hypothetical protein